MSLSYEYLPDALSVVQPEFEPHADAKPTKEKTEAVFQALDTWQNGSESREYSQAGKTHSGEEYKRDEAIERNAKPEGE